MIEKLQRIRTLTMAARGAAMTVVGVRLVLAAVAELRAPAVVVDLPVPEPTAEEETPAAPVEVAEQV